MQPAADLYRTLGVERGADPAAIRKAYRRAAKKAHPDAGGSNEKFAAIGRALAVLTDRKLRARYDETGEIGEPAPDNAEGNAMQVIALALDAVLNAMLQRNLCLSEIAVVSDMDRTIRNTIAQHREQMKRATRSLEQAKKAQTFCVAKKRGAPNRLLPLFGARIAALRRTIANLESQIAAHERALEILKDYEWKPDVATQKSYPVQTGFAGSFVRIG